jgi:hypothetical protein
MITVTDSTNQVVSFDKPLKLDYTHDAVNNDANYNAAISPFPHDGERFLLEYGGVGQLWGFPWEPEAGCDTSVAGNSCRWHASVTLKDGVQLSDGTNSFVIKALEKEQSMTTVANIDCIDAGLDVSTAGSLTLLESVDASLVTISFPAPVVTAAPAVIEGEVQ